MNLILSRYMYIIKAIWNTSTCIRNLLWNFSGRVVSAAADLQCLSQCLSRFTGRDVTGNCLVQDWTRQEGGLVGDWLRNGDRAVFCQNTGKLYSTFLNTVCISQDYPVIRSSNNSLPGFVPAGSTLKLWNFTRTLKPLGTIILYRQLDLAG